MRILRGNDLMGLRAEDVADALGMCRYSLALKLKEEGTGYRELLNQVRREKYYALMGSASHVVAEVLGFYSIQAFYRWHLRELGHKWSGKDLGTWKGKRYEPC